MADFNFKIEKELRNGLGRAGLIITPHGDIPTPAFIVVGTKATVKALTSKQLKTLGAPAILANTYHLYLQPGDEIVAQAGGFPKFMNWDGPSFTDSGGFQVFSLGAAYGEGGLTKFAVGKNSLELGSSASKWDGRHNSDLEAELPSPGGSFNNPVSSFQTSKLAKIDDNGVTFRSHLDGSEHRFTPKRSIQIQHHLGADIIFAFDECTAPSADYQYQKEALARTHAWALKSLEEHQRLGQTGRSLAEHQKCQLGLPPGSLEGGPSCPNSGPARQNFSEKNLGGQALFGIVQGGRHEDLRRDSAKFIGSLPFDGFGIGGSFDKDDMGTALRWVCEELPKDKPRHLLGIGAVEDIFTGVENGADTFDCVAPTREARNGSLYTKTGRINIRNAKYKNDFTTIDNDCVCEVCQNHTRAYLAHLFRANEILASTLASIHNLYFFVNLVKNIRQSILDDNFFEFKKEFLKKYHPNQTT